MWHQRVDTVAARNTGLAKVRSFCARFIGMEYRELPGFGKNLRTAIEDALKDLGAEKCGESGSPAYEVNNEYFQIRGRKLRVCTEDEMDVSLWGPKALTDDVHEQIIKRLRTNEGPCGRITDA